MESVVFLLFSSSIISMLGGTNQEPCIQKVYLGFLLTDLTKKSPTLAFFLLDLLKESLNKLFIYMVPDLYLQALRLLMIKTAEKRLIL
jgi:hypothetical protein